MQQLIRMNVQVITHCVLLILLLSLSAVSLAAHDRIQHGEVVNILDHPYMVGVCYTDKRQSYMCGGAIIASRTILTAGHCCINANKIVVSLRSSEFMKGNIVRVNKLIHDEYDSHFVDLCILKPDEHMFLNNVSAAAIRMSGKADVLKPREDVLVLGWGTTETNETSVQLRKAYLKAAKYLVCQNKYGVERVDGLRTLCTVGMPDWKSNVGKGDSGGPLIRVKDGKLFGITSDGDGFADGGPSIFAKVGYALDWIRKNIGPDEYY